MHCRNNFYDKKTKRNVMGCGCGHKYEMNGEGVVGDLFKGLFSAGKKLFSNLKLKELAASAGKSLLDAGKKALVEDVVPSLQKSAITLGTSAIERGTDELVSKIQNTKAPVREKTLLQETQNITKKELTQLKARVKQIALEQAQKAKKEAITNLQSLGSVEKEYEQIMDPISGGALLRLGEKRTRRRPRGSN